MKLFNSIQVVTGLFLAVVIIGALPSCSKTDTVTKTVIDTVTVAPVVPNYADSVSRSLWAYFNFNGSMNDQSGNNHNLTAVNNLSLGYDIYGNANDALNFDGVSNYGIIDSGAVFPSGDFTISFMVMSRNTSSGRIVQKADYNTAEAASFGFGFNGNGTGTFDFFVTSDPTICTDVTTSSNTTLMHATELPTTYAWYYVTLIFSQGTEEVYINGTLSGSQVTPNTTFVECSTAPIYLGMWWTQSPLYFDGEMDELRIYTRVLSNNEIAYLAQDALNPL